MRTIEEIREAKRSTFIRSLAQDVQRLQGEQRLHGAYLIGSYQDRTFSGVSDIDLVCIVDDEINPGISAADFLLSSEKPVDLIFVKKGTWDGQPAWVKQGLLIE